MFTIDFKTLQIINKTQGFEVFEFQDPRNTGLQYKDGNLIPITFNGKDYLINLSGGGPRGHALPLDNVYIYDIFADKWYRQPVSGASPTNTRGACTVTNYAPDNSSIQIIFFGGKIYSQTKNDFFATDDTWVLTIPSFTWIHVGNNTAPIGPGPREEHTCHLTGSQMIVIGGQNSSSICEKPGVWVFDTTKLSWKSNFTADTSYLVPKMVSDIISGGENGGAPWDNLPLKKGPDPASPFYNITGVQHSKTKSTPVGAITGAVIGGVILVAVAAIASYVFYKRLRQKTTNAPIPPPAGPQDDHYVEKGHPFLEFGSPKSSSIAPFYSTLGAAQPVQLHGDTSFPVELPSQSQGPVSPIVADHIYELPNRQSVISAVT
ncbi:hypothetical protein AA313_de0210384 [Arthrobotrys entomopaga]|nr:hypothetical protein AA313_de0210384 [Arthrobotrys entomopaga]